MYKIPIESFRDFFVKNQAMRLRRLKKGCKKNPCHSDAEQGKNIQELDKKYGGENEKQRN